MSRMLAAKVALAARFDAFGESDTISMDLGTNHLANLEYKLRLMEEGSMTRISGTAKAKAKFEKYQVKRYLFLLKLFIFNSSLSYLFFKHFFFREIVQYSAAADSTIPSNKRKVEDIDVKQEYKVKSEEIKEEPEGDKFFFKFICFFKKKKNTYCLFLY